MKKLLLLSLLLLITATVTAQEISITRNIIESASFDETFTETIKLKNNQDKTIQLTLTEKLPASVEFIEPKEHLVYQGWEALKVPFIIRNIKINQSSEIVLEHKFRALDVGEIYFQPIIITFDQTQIESTELILEIKCNSNNICELENGENYLTCPNDCPSGSADNICDFQEDNICDPDCISGDIDCEEYCGDGICQKAKESDYTCPDDCRVEEGKEKNYTWIYWTTGIILLLAIILLIFKSKKPKIYNPQQQVQIR